MQWKHFSEALYLFYISLISTLQAISSEICETIVPSSSAISLK